MIDNSTFGIARFELIIYQILKVNSEMLKFVK